jgi:hypothetical protein
MMKNGYNLADLVLFGEFAVLKVSETALVVVDIEPLSPF